MKQRENFKGAKRNITNICKNISTVFDAIFLKFNKKSKSNGLQVERKLNIWDLSCLSLLLEDLITSKTLEGRSATFWDQGLRCFFCF